jgi:diguanylate cyclase (GGDEF)-like protein
MGDAALELSGSDFARLPVALTLLDGELRSLYVNDAWSRLAGGGNGPAGTGWETALDQRDLARIREALRGVIANPRDVTLQVRGQAADQWLELRAAAVDHGEAGEVLLLALDITEQKEREAMLAFDAVRDQLTGLHNRAALGQHLQAALDRLHRHPSILAALFIDLDGFRQVNERYGHVAGDRALVIAAQQLRLAIRPEDLLARVGGDEFVAVCESLSSAEEALGVAGRLAASLEEPVEISPTAELQLSATIGVAFASGPREDVAALLTRADLAMYAGKQQGPGRIQLHDPMPLGFQAPRASSDSDQLNAVAERLSILESELAEGWADSLMRRDARRIQRWRSACHYVGRALASLRAAKSTVASKAADGNRT